MKHAFVRHFVALFAILAFAFTSIASSTFVEAQEKRALTVTDIMKFKEAEDFTLSKDGRWIAYSAVPDRGAIVGHIHSTDGSQHFTVEEGTKPMISSDGQWAAFTKAVSLLEKETTPKTKQKDLKAGLVLINLSNGEQTSYEAVKSAQFSGDSSHIGISFHASNDKDKTKASSEEADTETNAAGEAEEEKEHKAAPHYQSKSKLGTPFKLINLSTMENTEIEAVSGFQFADKGSFWTYRTTKNNGSGNALMVHDLATNTAQPLDETDLASYPQMQWSEDGTMLAFTKGSFTEKTRQRTHSLHLYSAGSDAATLANTSADGWFLSNDNRLTWSEDGARLFYGQKPVTEAVEPVDTKVEDYDDLFDVEKLLAQKELQVWHGDDPRINPQQQVAYNRDLRKTYLHVLHVAENRNVAIANEDIPTANATDNPTALLAMSDVPYLKLRTWDGFYNDIYHVDLATGERQLVVEKQGSRDMALSPSGRYVAYYRDQAYWLYDSSTGTISSLTADIVAAHDLGFGDELHDYPSDVPGYGIAGWIEGDQGVLIYDRYDIWLVQPNGDYVNLTEGDGRKREITYRLVKADKDQNFFDANQRMLVRAYYDKTKQHGFYQLSLDAQGVSALFEGNKTYRFVAKAEEADTYIYTREDLGEFPDYWVSRSSPRQIVPEGTKLTTINPQIDQFSWGEPILVDWTSTQGKPLQGVLIKPANYEEGKRYPVVVYYYRYFSQRMYNWNQMKVNHRPNFPYYSSNGYAVFLPDVKFEVGYPGPSATAALVPGVQKIIDMGIADPDAIGLHGHSWSGYQTAHVITQTDMFAAAVTGAPVSNMTSAYTGIRLGSGLARQFQYEKTQSRIGATLYDKPHLYIENSPIFFAERINTPTLIMHGDIDDAVPWQQSIELYLAMRRLDKEVVFLQYEGEPHHLKKYPNKVDYTLKMKAYFDHYLKGEPAESWITEGVPFSKPDPEKPVK